MRILLGMIALLLLVSTASAGYRVVGLRADNNSTTLAMVLSADYVILRNPIDGSTKEIMAPSGLTASISGGQYVAGTTLWAYFLWGETPGITAIFSPAAPPTGPPLSNGFTHYAPAFSVVVAPGTSMYPGLSVSGDVVSYTNAIFVNVCGGGPCGLYEHVVSLAPYVPAKTISVKMQVDCEVAAINGDAAYIGCIPKVRVAKNFANLSTYANTVAVGGTYPWSNAAQIVIIDLPMDDSLLYRQQPVLIMGSPWAIYQHNFVMGYRVANGG